MSSSNRTKHIKAKFFFVTDKVEQGEVVIEHKPTEQMWIDVNTKPKQGTPYRVDRSEIMNCPVEIPDETLSGTRRSIPALKSKSTKQKSQECVEVPSKSVRGQSRVQWPRKVVSTIVRAGTRPL